MRLIDADALRRAMYHEAMEKDSDEQKWDSGCWIRYKMFERIIEAQPTIEPERKTGKWLKLYTGNYKCSVCGDWWGNDDNDMVEDFKYCPYCGCEMEG